MEAASRDEEVEDEVKRKIDEALACTCVDDLKDGPCGDSFVEAFSCFIRSQHKSLEVRRNLKNYSPSSNRPPPRRSSRSVQTMAI